MAKSNLEELFAFQINASGFPSPEREYRFHDERRWRFDFCWPEYGIAAEVEGGVWTKGRHVRGAGFVSDCEKYNEAAVEGWLVLRFPGVTIKNGQAIEVLERAFNSKIEE